MPTSPKPFVVLTNEKKSHRTKAELNQRKQAEESLLTGKALRVHTEVKNDPVALKEFNRINGLLRRIEKNDAIYEPVINRYCLIYAECLDFVEKRETFYRDMQELTEDKDRLIDNGEMTLGEYYKTKQNLQNTIINLDRQIQAKRKMLLDIEKENAMTIAAALRSIPKTPPAKKANAKDQYFE